MNDFVSSAIERPRVRPKDPRFSSGPCKKHPGWTLSSLDTQHLGRSHRATLPKARLQSAIDRSASLLELPSEWKLGIVPGSDTGAFELAMWSLLGSRAVDALVWESFSSDWANDLAQLDLPGLKVHKADYGLLPDVNEVSPNNDVVLVFNGTTSGVRMPNLNWVANDREGLVLCDATSAAFAMNMDFDKVDVLTWSWQKGLGGEAAHGMLALSPRALARLESAPAPRALPKIFRLTKNQKIIDGVFKGATINTPSMLAVEDLHSALDWAETIGGLPALISRCESNFQALDEWVQRTDWVDWLPSVPDTRSTTSMCLKIIDKAFAALDEEHQNAAIKTMVSWLADEAVAFDIAHYRSAPAGFRIWGGATIESEDIKALTAWLDWAFQTFSANELTAEVQHG